MDEPPKTAPKVAPEAPEVVTPKLSAPSVASLSLSDNYSTSLSSLGSSSVVKKTSLIGNKKKKGKSENKK